MSLAVLLPSTTLAAPLRRGDGVPLADRIRDQLHDAGAREVVVLDHPGELIALAEGADEPLLICTDDLVAHTAVLRHLNTSPAGPTVALILSEATAGTAGIREERGQVTAVTFASVACGGAGSPSGAVTGGFGGALRVGVGDLPALAAATRSIADGTALGPPGRAIRCAGAAQPSPTSIPVLDRLVAALVTGTSAGTAGSTAAGTAGTIVNAHRVRLLVARRVANQSAADAAEAELRRVDPDRAELRLAVKERDDLFATYAVSTWSPQVTRLAARIGLSPTGVTAISIGFAAVAAALFAVGGRPPLVLGAVLLYLSFVLDCVDGQLARYTRRFSAFGGWLDTIADRGKEYLVYAGLGSGAVQAGWGNGWALAIAAIGLQTVRHMTDAWYGALHDEAARRQLPVPAPRTPAGDGAGGSAEDGPGPRAGVGDRLSRVSTRVLAAPGSLIYWCKRTVVFPIGERWALIAITVVLFDPRVSLLAILAWGALAAAYTLALRTLRAYSMRVPVLARVDTGRYRDDGVLARGIGATWARLGGGRSAATSRIAGGAGGPGQVPVRAAGAGQLPIALGVAGVSVVLLAGVTVGGWSGGIAERPRWLVPLAVAVAVGVALVTAAGAGRRATGALDWLVPAALRAAEVLLVVAVGIGAVVPAPITYVLLFALALHYYDLTARLEKRLEPPRWPGLTLGWDGRIVVLALAVAAQVATVAMTVLAGYLLLVFLAGAVGGWRAAARLVRQPSAATVRTPSLAGTGGAGGAGTGGIT